MPRTADDPRRAALTALDRAVHLLDRGFAPAQKVRAFRNARAVLADLDDDELIARAAGGTLTDLAGIGPSTASVITDAVTDGPGTYLADLDRTTRPDPGVGAPMREALRGDCHLHSDWSDGGAALADMAATAAGLGHEYMVITDHSPRLTVAHGLSPERLREQLGLIEELNTQLAPFRILTGMEVDILLDGSLDLPEDLLATLDVVVASVHSKLAMPEAEMTRRMVLAAASPHVDILGHCTGRQIVGTGRAPSRFDADLVFAACARFGTAVEINCRPERQDPPDDLLDAALAWGCLVSIDTDAHATGQLEWQWSGCDKAVRHDIEPSRVINTWSATELVDWTASKADV